MSVNEMIQDAMTIQLDYELPEYPAFVEGIRRAPRRESHMTEADKALAIQNALRYIHPDHHEQMAKEFAQELETRGRIYGYRFRPAGKLYGKPIDEYKGNCIEGRAIQVMIDNNLDFDVALYPYELTTYGETGQVCQNWMQYRLIKKYLEALTDEQTPSLCAGRLCWSRSCCCVAKVGIGCWRAPWAAYYSNCSFVSKSTCFFPTALYAWVPVIP